MNVKKTAAALVIAAGIVAIPALAARSHGGFGGGRMFGRAAAALNLTDTQKATAQQLMTDAKAQAEPIVTELKQNRQDLEAAVKGNDTGRISQLTARQGELRGQLGAIRATSMARFYAQLTPDQKAKAEELKQRFQERAKNHRGAEFRNRQQQ